MKNLLITFILFYSIQVFPQSEPHNFITYDTTLNIGYANLSYNFRITRPDNTDTTVRPAIIFMSGTGEVGTNKALMASYGPHYLIGNGWSGGIQLGNGTHYPILISVQPNQVWPQTKELLMVITHLLKTYHIKRGSVHLTGLSMGAMAWAALICHQSTPGAEDGMKNITSLTCLEGQSNQPSASVLVNQLGGAGSYNSFGHWAKKYGGKFFGLEGTGDNGRNVWLVSKNMNDSVPGSAYFSYENIGGGLHCCWNSMYDPLATNWRSVVPFGPNNSPSQFNAGIDMMGTYSAPSGLFQWMLRQGDTTLVGTPSPVIITISNKAPIAVIALPSGITAPHEAILLDGTGSYDTDGQIDSVKWSQVSGPSPALFSNPTCWTTGVLNMIPGTYIFKLTVWDDKGATGLSLVTVTVNPPPKMILKTITVFSDGTMQ
jgi:hypothetical protein